MTHQVQISAAPAMLMRDPTDHATRLSMAAPTPNQHNKINLACYVIVAVENTGSMIKRNTRSYIRISIEPAPPSMGRGDPRAAASRHA
jgi:hypothetical protein